MKLMEIVGNNHTLSFKSLKGRHDRRNIFLDDLVDYSTVKQIEYSLEALAIVLIILQKLYAKQVIETAYNGHCLADVKAARRTCRNRGYGREFIDNGLSFKTIAKRLNVSIQKAFFITLFGENLGFFLRIKNVTQIYRRDAALAFANSGENYTFHTKNNLYKVGANRYELSQQVLALLGMGIN
jgi:hypothetical protein